MSATTAGTSITAGFAGGVLTLSGVDTVAHYEQVLRTIKYENTAGTPNQTIRNVEFVANDGANLSLLSTAEVGIFRSTYSARLNEINLDPPGNDNPYEYIEIQGAPGASLSGMFVASFNSQFVFGNPGEPGVGQTGTAQFVFDLSSYSLGSNGLLVIKSPTGGFTPPAETTVVTDAQLDDIGGGLRNGSNSFFLIHVPTAIVEGTDYDLNDDGTLDLPVGSTVVDSVSWKDRNREYDITYGTNQLTQFDGSPDAVTRFPGNTAPSAAAWYNGDLNQTGLIPTTVDYDPANASDNFPTGAFITPGAPNYPQNSSIVGRHIFYNQSMFDGQNPAVTSADDNAIATDKSPYFPGGGIAPTSSMTSFQKGINGIMVDIAGTHGAITDADFVFKVGANNTPSTWAAAPAPATISVRAGAGVSGSDRVEIVWANNTIQKTWLEITVKGNDAAGGFNTNTGLAASDTFYFGNIIGDTFLLSPPTVAVVNATDEIHARSNGGFPAAVTNAFDFDRNGFVNASDQIIARVNGFFLTRINITNPPAAPAAPATAPATATDDGSSTAVASALAIDEALSEWATEDDDTLIGGLLESVL